MARPRNTVPTVRYHKPSDSAYCDFRDPVTDRRRSICLGRWGSKEAKLEHARVLSELASGRADPGESATVSELCLAFIKWAQTYYVKDGKPTGEMHPLKDAIKVLRQTHGHVNVNEFTPRAMVAVRDRMVALDWCRTTINKQVARIRRAFKWGVSEMLVAPATLTALSAVAPLKEGRSQAREKERVTAVPDEVVADTLPHLSVVVRAMVQLQRLAGMRPGEVVRLRPCDVDTSGSVWTYTPSRHKCEHLGRLRVVMFGPRAQAVLTPFLTGDPQAYCFNPRESVAELRERQKADRAARAGGSGGDRKVKATDPKRRAGGRYTTSSFTHAIKAGVGRANERRARLAGEDNYDPLPEWSGNQLRHAAAAEIAERMDLEKARATLGHSAPAMTQNYAKSADGRMAAEVARLLG